MRIRKNIDKHINFISDTNKDGIPCIGKQPFEVVVKRSSINFRKILNMYLKIKEIEPYTYLYKHKNRYFVEVRTGCRSYNSAKLKRKHALQLFEKVGV